MTRGQHNGTGSGRRPGHRAGVTITQISGPGNDQRCQSLVCPLVSGHPPHSGLLDLELAFSLYPMYSTGFIFNVEFRAMIGWWLHAPLVRLQTLQFVGFLRAGNNKQGSDFRKDLKFCRTLLSR